MGESRPRALTPADLAAMNVGTQPVESRPMQNPPSGAGIPPPQAAGQPNRPSDALFTANTGDAVSESADKPAAKANPPTPTGNTAPRKSRG